jgi:uncharacterized protein (AIM24 family)
MGSTTSSPADHGGQTVRPPEGSLGAADVKIVGPVGDRHLIVSFGGSSRANTKAPAPSSRGGGSRASASKVSGVLAEAGAMVWMTPGVSIATSLAGGVLKALARVRASETAFVNAFFGASGSLALAPDFPCDILELTIEPGGALEVAAGAFLASDDGVTVSGRPTLLGGLIGQSDLVSVRLDNPGARPRRAWIAGNGATQEHKLFSAADGLLVDNHRALACTPGAKNGYAKVGGKVSAIFGGEGIVQSFTGPGVVWTQTRRSLPYLIEKVAGARDSSGGGMNVPAAAAGGVALVAAASTSEEETHEDEAAEGDFDGGSNSRNIKPKKRRPVVAKRNKKASL